LAAGAVSLGLALGSSRLGRIGLLAALVLIALRAGLGLTAALGVLGLRLVLVLFLILLLVLLGLGFVGALVRAFILLLTGLVAIRGLVLLHVAGIFAVLVLGVFGGWFGFAWLGRGALAFALLFSP